MRTWLVLCAVTSCLTGCADTSDGRWPVQVFGDTPMGLWGPKTPTAAGALCTPLRRTVDSLPGLEGATPLAGFRCEIDKHLNERAYWCRRDPSSRAETRQVVQQLRACFPEVKPTPVDDEGYEWAWEIADRRFVSTGLDEDDYSTTLYIVVSPYELE